MQADIVQVGGKAAAPAVPPPATREEAARATEAAQPAAVPPPIDEEERHQMIEVGAYYRAAARGFASGSALSDWLEAEAEIDRRLGRGPGREPAG